MQPHTVHRSARDTWTSTPVHFGGREFRRVRFSNGVRVTFAVWEHKTPSVFTGTIITRRAAATPDRCDACAFVGRSVVPCPVHRERAA